MRKRFRVLSVVFSRLALIAGLLVLPTVGHSISPCATTCPIYNWIPPSSLGGASPSDFVTTPTDDTHTVPMWLGLDNGYYFAMAGKDPTVKASGPTSITTKIVPLRFTAAPSYVFDTESNDSCSPQRTPALNMVQQSPLFRPISLPGTLKTLGTNQFLSLFQRANFWIPYIEPKGPNVNYQVVFSQILANKQETPKYTISISSPPSTTLPYSVEGQVQTDPTWCNPVAMISVQDLDTLLQTQVIPGLRNYDVVPATLPIFILSNVVMYDSNISNCCILGYHNAYLSTDVGVFSGKLQTYIVANYNSTTYGNYTGAFPNAPDIVGLSNMMAGWMDNPTNSQSHSAMAGNDQRDHGMPECPRGCLSPGRERNDADRHHGARPQRLSRAGFGLQVMVLWRQRHSSEFRLRRKLFPVWQPYEPEFDVPLNLPHRYALGDELLRPRRVRHAAALAAALAGAGRLP